MKKDTKILLLVAGGGLGLYLLSRREAITEIIPGPGQVMEYVKESVGNVVEGAVTTVTEKVTEVVTNTVETIREVSIFPPEPEKPVELPLYEPPPGTEPLVQWAFPPWVKPVLSGVVSASLLYTPFGIDLLTQRLFGLEPWWNRIFGYKPVSATVGTPSYAMGMPVGGRAYFQEALMPGLAKPIEVLPPYQRKKPYAGEVAVAPRIRRRRPGL